MKSTMYLKKITLLYPLILVSVFVLMGFVENESPKEAVVKHFINNTANHNNLADPFDKIVIDAGHGGKDPGCSGSHAKEKVIALDIAKRLGKMLNAYHPEIEVIYTRETDVFIPLNKRIDMANKHQADLFISIHCNYVPHGKARGTETYVMGLHRAEDNLEVAKRENSVILLETDYKKTYQGYDPYSPEGHILLSMVQNAHLEQSISIASKIEDSFGSRTRLKSRGVKQAGFVVLREATMPSILVETGFLSNSIDEAYLKSEVGQKEVASSIVKAITEYKIEIEGQYWLTSTPEIANPTASYEPIASSENSISSSISSSTSTSTYQQKLDQPKAETSTIISNSNAQPLAGHNTTKSYSGATIYNGPGIEVSNSSEHIVGKTQSTGVTTQYQTGQQEIIYRVQIAASVKKPLLGDHKEFNRFSDLEIKLEQGMYKYLTGHYYDLNEALTQREYLLNDGFKGAFVVAYLDGTRVDM